MFLNHVGMFTSTYNTALFLVLRSLIAGSVAVSAIHKCAVFASELLQMAEKKSRDTAIKWGQNQIWARG